MGRLALTKSGEKAQSARMQLADDGVFVAAS